MLIGKLKSLEEQLYIAERELHCSRETCHQVKTTSSNSEIVHHTNLKHLQESRNEVKQQYNSLIEEYNVLLGEYE